MGLKVLKKELKRILEWFLTQLTEEDMPSGEETLMLEVAEEVFENLRKHGVTETEIIHLIRLAGVYGLRITQEKLTENIDLKARKKMAQSLRALAKCYETIDFQPLLKALKEKEKEGGKIEGD